MIPLIFATSDLHENTHLLGESMDFFYVAVLSCLFHI